MGSVSLEGAVLGRQALPLHLQSAPVPCARVQGGGAHLREGPPPQCALSGLRELRLCGSAGTGAPGLCLVSPRGLLASDRTGTPPAAWMF